MDDGDGLTPKVESWKQMNEAAMLELDPEKLPKRIAEAQKAIEERVRVSVRTVERRKMLWSTRTSPWAT